MIKKLKNQKLNNQKLNNQNLLKSPMMAVFSANESILRKFLRRFTSSFHDVEDITQETIFRALKIEKTKEIHEPRAFLFGIARNVARKHLDKKSKSLIDFIEDYEPKEYISSEVSLEDTIMGHDRLELFGQAVLSLPEQCQKVFVLKKVYGFTHQEISKKLGISISTTEKHVAAGLKRCSEFMSNAVDESDSIQKLFSKSKVKTTYGITS